MNKWEEDLRSKLSSYNPQPPAGMWEKLEGGLSKEQQAGTSPSDRLKRAKLTRRLLYVLSPVAAAACLVLALLPLHHSQGNVEREGKQSLLGAGMNSQGWQSVSADAELGSPATHENVALAQAVPLVQEETAATRGVENDNIDGGENSNGEEKNSRHAIATYNLDIDTRTGKDSVTTASARNNRDGAVMYVAKARSRKGESAPTPHHGKSSSGLSFALSLQGSPNAENFMAGSYVGTLSASPVVSRPQAGGSESAIEVGKPGVENPSPDDGGIAKPGDAYTSVLLNNLRNDVSTVTRHRLPLTFAVTVAYPFAKNFSVDASLVYTHASSDFRSGSVSDYYATKQKLDYFGPALHLGWTFLETHPFTAYLRAGMTLQGCVSGNQKTDYVVSGRSSADEISVGIGKGLWQASADASLGMQFNIIPSLGIYVEPGVSRYIDDGSSLSTYAHDHPTAFSLKAGLRFTLPKK